MGRGRGPDADRLTYRVMGRGARVGGVRVPETQGDAELGRDKETQPGEKSETARHADLERPVQGVQKFWRRQASPSPPRCQASLSPRQVPKACFPVFSLYSHARPRICVEETQDTTQNLTQGENGACLKGREKRSRAHSWPRRRFLGPGHLCTPVHGCTARGPGAGGLERGVDLSQF